MPRASILEERTTQTMDNKQSDDPRIETYYSLQPFKFHHVERLEIHQISPEEGYVTFLEMVLRHSDPADNRRLFLKFEGVLNLRITPPMRAPLYMTQLEIGSIRDRQWEGANYSVKEVEDEAISFLCRYFTSTVI